VIRVPLKTAAQLFSLFKIIVFPMRLSPDTFIRYQLQYHYFGLAVDQRDYTLLTEADLQRCTTSSVTICPAEVPLYNSQLLTCEGSLFLQYEKLPTVPQERAASLPNFDFYITGRSGCITSRIHGRSTFDVPRIMAGPHVRCLSEADSFTTHPFATSLSRN